MEYHKLVISLLVLSSMNKYSHGYDPDLPADIQKCTIADEKCLLDGMNYVIRNYAATGSKGLGLVRLDPLRIKKLSLGKNPNSPVSIDLSFSNADLIGLSEAQVQRVSAFTKDLSRPIVFDMASPRITLRGPYSVEGRVLILPVVGKGNAQIVLENCQVHAVVKLSTVSKGPHQTYAEVTEVKMRLEPSRVIYKLDGLFNGQKELSENLHVLINENWREVFNELKSDIAGAMGLIFKAVLNKTIGKLPLEQLFSDL
ncbi:protein takeout [Drosophila montana]|uniref:protein takeout n=1 Tax=Drosophila montana TaxID=40370 RepID=UPI00313BA1EB